MLYGDVGCGKTHLAIAIGTLACRRGIPVRFFTASGLIMRLRKAKADNRLDQEGCARSLAQKRSGPLPGRFQSVVCMVSPSRDMSR